MSSEKKTASVYAVTGTFHGSIVYAECEGDARRAFHAFYNGESILNVKRVPATYLYG